LLNIDQFSQFFAYIIINLGRTTAQPPKTPGRRLPPFGLTYRTYIFSVKCHRSMHERSEYRFFFTLNRSKMDKVARKFLEGSAVTQSLLGDVYNYISVHF